MHDNSQFFPSRQWACRHGIRHRRFASLRAGYAMKPRRSPDDAQPAASAGCHPPFWRPGPAATVLRRDSGCAGPRCITRRSPRYWRRHVPTATLAPPGGGYRRTRHRSAASHRWLALHNESEAHRDGVSRPPAPAQDMGYREARCFLAAQPGSSGGGKECPVQRIRAVWEAGE